MGKYLKKFENHDSYELFITSGDYPKPNVSYCVAENEVYYNPIVLPYQGFCKLTLNDGSIVELEGSGELAYSMTSAYTNTIVSAEIGEACTSIDEYAFYYYSGLTSVTIGNGVTSIGYEAFYYCSSLTSVTIGNGVTSIDEYAFYYCSSLASVTIPDSVTSISSYAFGGCSSLTSVTIGNSVTYITNNAFDGTPWWSTYSADTNNHYGNILYINNIAYQATATTITSCEFKEGTVSIGDYAFASCSGLTSIDIPNSVTSIGDNAFNGCSGLTSVTIGSGVTSISVWAFSNCTKLNSITSLATTAPTIQKNTFRTIKQKGTLTVPQGSSGYDVWMSTSNYYLGLYNWTKVEQ